MIKETIINYIFSRLQETSTIRGLIAFIGGLAGYSFSNNTEENLVYIILGIIGLIGAFFPDIIKKKSESLEEVKPLENEEPEKIISKSYSIGSNISLQSSNSKLQTSSKLPIEPSTIRNQETAISGEFSGFNDK